MHVVAVVGVVIVWNQGRAVDDDIFLVLLVLLLLLLLLWKGGWQLPCRTEWNGVGR
jgi:NhaP-type Na+/H+ or K+/H+ antiporter